MNYFLVALVLGMAGFAYYQHNQDELQVADLQQQIADLKKGGATSGQTGGQTPGQTASVTTVAPDGTAPSANPPSKPSLTPAPKQAAPLAPHSSAIDQAASAATAAATSNSNSIGTVTTLDGRTFQNCKVVKVESDGVTFSHDDGITKVLFPFLPPAIQKQFDYDPQKAVSEADAKVRYDQQQSAAAPASNTAPAPANP